LHHASAGEGLGQEMNQVNISNPDYAGCIRGKLCGGIILALFQAQVFAAWYQAAAGVGGIELTLLALYFISKSYSLIQWL
jgi:hypothetical protein